jgi:hypothetical protein
MTADKSRRGDACRRENNSRGEAESSRRVVTDGVRLLQTSLSHREGHEARCMGLEAVKRYAAKRPKELGKLSGLHSCDQASLAQLLIRPAVEIVLRSPVGYEDVELSRLFSILGGGEN